MKSLKTLGRLILGAMLCSPNSVLAQFAYWPVSSGGNGHYYEAVATAGINWFQASAMATNKGGYLATITSTQENAFVFELIRTNSALWALRPTGNSFGPWLGGYQPEGSAEPDGGWAWVTGEPFAYTNWFAGEPNNLNGTENRLHFWAEQSPAGDVWNDKDGNDTAIKGFVIEYDPHPNAAFIQISLTSTNQVQLSWQSRTNVNYTVQWTAEVPAGGWSTLTNLSGSGGTNYASDAISESRRFYRVVSTP